jgi:tetratricopeptide (TPR) repeat protein
VSKKKHKHPVPAAVKGPAANKQNGLRAFRQNDFTTAIRLWSQIDLQSDPAMRPALAEAHFRHGLSIADPQSRLPDLQRALELLPAEGRFWYHLGMEQHRADRLDEALAAYTRAIECGDQRPVRLRVLAQLERDPHFPLEGLAEIDRDALLPVALLLRNDSQAVLHHLLAPNQNQAAAQLWRGLASLAINDLTAARDLLTPQGKSLRAGAEATRAYYHGLATWAGGDHDAAITEWRTAAARTPTPRLLAIVAAEQAQQLKTLLSDEQWDVALLTAQAALRLTPDQPELLSAQLIALHRLALAAQQRSDWPAAIQHWHALSAVLEAHPQLGIMTPVLYNLALAYEKSERWAEAATTWDQLRNKLPPRPSAKSQATLQLPLPVPEFRVWLRRHVLDCYKHTGDLEGALTQYRALIKSTPDDLDLRYEFAEALISNAQEVAARNEAQRILQKDENRTDARLLLVDIHLERGELYAAEQQARLALERDPNHAGARQAVSDVLSERGHNLFEFGRYAEAKKLYEEALALTPDHAQVLIWQGNTELALRNKTEAARCFDLALSKATDLHIYVSVFECWAMANDLEAARALIPRAQAAGFATAHFYVDLAGICLAQAAPPAPPAFFGPPPKQKKSGSNPWEQLGREMLQQAEAAPGDPAETLREIVAALGSTQPDLAIEYAQRLIKLTPDDPIAWLILAVMQALSGQIKPAKDTARQAASLARKQNNASLVREIDAFRQELDMPLPFMGSGLFGGGFDDDFDDEELF